MMTKFGWIGTMNCITEHKAIQDGYRLRYDNWFQYSTYNIDHVGDSSGNILRILDLVFDQSCMF